MLSSLPLRSSKAAMQKAEREGSAALWSTKRSVPTMRLAPVLWQYRLRSSSFDARTLVESRDSISPEFRSSVCSKAQYAQMLSMLKAQPRSSTNLYRILDKTQSRNSRTTSCRSNKVQMSPNRELRAKTKSLWFQQVNNSGSASSQSRCQSRNTRALKPEMIKRINARCPQRYRRRHKANAPSEKCRCTV